MPFSRGSSQSRSSAFQADTLLSEPPGLVCHLKMIRGLKDILHWSIDDEYERASLTFDLKVCIIDFLESIPELFYDSSVE